MQCQKSNSSESSSEDVFTFDVLDKTVKMGEESVCLDDEDTIFENDEEDNGSDIMKEYSQSSEDADMGK